MMLEKFDKVCVKDFKNVDLDNPLIYEEEVDFVGNDRRIYSLRRIVKTGNYEIYNTVFDTYMIDVEIEGINQLIRDSKENEKVQVRTPILEVAIQFMNQIAKFPTFAFCNCKKCCSVRLLNKL